MTLLDELRKTNGRYKTNKLVRQKIDNILHQNAIAFQELGAENTQEDYYKLKKQEWKNLQRIKELDYAFYKLVCPYNRPNDL